MGDLCQTNLGVSHGCRVITVHRAKVTLAIDQHVAQGEVLGHPHDRVVDRRIAMGVVLTNHVTDDTGGFFVGPVPVVIELVHRKKHTPVHRLEPVANIRQRPPNDHAHGVIEIGPTHFLF